MSEAPWDIVWPLAVLLGTALGAILLVWLLQGILSRIFRKVPRFRERTAALKIPFTIILASVATQITLNVLLPDSPWISAMNFLMPVILVAALTWMAIVVLSIIEAGVLYRYRGKIHDARRLARLRTQVTLLRRVVTALIITLAVAAILLTIPQVRALGAGVLASAGLISIVAGLAVQSSLSNVFAGLQLAFTDAVRVDDVVVVNGEWGAVEEITLTYVVVTLYDDRRLILPSTFFTSQPFENWSRQGAQLLGAVYLDVDWNVPIEPVREHLQQVLKGTDLWDGRTGSLVVTDAVSGMVQLRALVSARDSGELWDLRCLVREQLIDFIQKQHPAAMPRQRWEPVS